MSKINIILDFQKLDMQKRRTINDIYQSEHADNVKKFTNAFNSAKQVTVDMDKKSLPLVEFFDKFQGYCNDTNNAFAELNKSIESCNDIAQLEERIERMSAYKNKLVEAKRKLVARKGEAENIVKEYRAALDKGKKMKTALINGKNKLDELHNSKKDVLDNLTGQMKLLRDSGDSLLFSWYDELSKQNKLPAFVPLSGQSNCGGCGLEVSQKTLETLKVHSTCRCDTCSRVVYYTKL